MSAAPANPYLRTKIMTASSEELRLMLFDGAMRFCRQARTALDAKNFEDSYNALMRAQKIVLELSSSLNHDVDRELTQKMAALYTFIYRRLVDANVQRDVEAIDEAVRLLSYERETWAMLINKARGDETPRPAAAPPSTGARQTAISSYSRSA
jgi:flagellar protein FliS